MDRQSTAMVENTKTKYNGTLEDSMSNEWHIEQFEKKTIIVGDYQAGCRKNTSVTN